MSRKWYGSLNNRVEENKQFCDKIEVGTGMTEYSWSDRHAYEVTAVKDQKHVTVREYDAKHVGEAYTNKWELVSNPENPELNLTKRGITGTGRSRLRLTMYARSWPRKIQTSA